MKLKKEFGEFYNRIKIDKENFAQDLIDKRNILEADIKDGLPENLSLIGIDINKSDIKVKDQGSYRINTTIVAEPVDRDVSIIVPIDIEAYNDPVKIKKAVYNSLIHINRTINIKEPCVTVSYLEDDKEYLHIDLPIYANYNGSLYLARGKEFSSDENKKWEMTDLDGLNKYMDERLNDHSELRRVVRFIKKWKYEKYKNTSENMKNQIPPSIGLTLMAFDCYSEPSEKDDDLVASYNTMNNMLNNFSVTKDIDGNIIKASITKLLPVEPYTDVFYKLKNSDSYGVTFYNRLSKAVINLQNAINSNNEYEAGKYVVKVLGEEFNVPEKQAFRSSSISNREHSFG